MHYFNSSNLIKHLRLFPFLYENIFVVTDVIMKFNELIYKNCLQKWHKVNG